MLQIAIWGIAFVLIVKGLDVLHRQSNSSAPLAWVTAILAFVFAIILFVTSSKQTGEFSATGILNSSSSDYSMSPEERQDLNDAANAAMADINAATANAAGFVPQ